MTDTKLLVVCYRALLRWSSRCRHAPLGLTLEHIQEVCPSLGEKEAVLQENTTLGSLIRWQFRRREVNTTGNEDSDPVEQAFAALRLLNTHYEPIMKSLEERRAAHRNRHGVLFQIGEVVEHKVRHYRGVVTGWDRVCEEIGSLEDPDVNLVQPFYRIVTDDSSTKSSFVETAWLQYLPQDVLRSMKYPNPGSSEEFTESFVSSVKLGEYFSGYSSSLTRYVPHPQVQWEYPDDYHATDARPFPKSGPQSLVSTSGTSKSPQKSRTRRKGKPSAGPDKTVPEDDSASSSKDTTEPSTKSGQNKQMSTSDREKNTKAEGQDKIG